MSTTDNCQKRQLNLVYAEEAKAFNKPDAPALNPDFSTRFPTKVVNNRLQGEGVGVNVRRSIGSNPRYYDPFALLDNFLFDENSIEHEVGFECHPHAGLSTLTYMLNGAIEHQDHMGTKGQLYPGDVQFMVAGKGIVHSEMPITNKKIDGMQLWVNLPKDKKEIDPYYQEYANAELPEITQGGIWAKIIAGNALGYSAPIKTVTPVHYVHYKLQPHTTLQHVVPFHYNSFIYVINGRGKVGTGEDAVPLQQWQTSFFDATEEGRTTCQNNPQNFGITVQTQDSPLDFVLVAGEPLGDKPSEVVQYGPMIMSSMVGVQQKFQEFRTGQGAFKGAHQFMQSWVRPGPEADNADKKD